MAGAFVPNARGRWQCDLVALTRQRAGGLGLTGIYGGDWCTLPTPSASFHIAAMAVPGRMAALIWRL